MVAYAATHTKNEFRAFLHHDPPSTVHPRQNEAEPAEPGREADQQPRATTPSRMEEYNLPLVDEAMYTKRVVHQGTDEVQERIIVRFTLEVDTERKAQLVRERLSPFFRFPTTSRTVLEKELYAIPTT
jgi:hypothetical protein